MSTPANVETPAITPEKNSQKTEDSALLNIKEGEEPTHHTRTNEGVADEPNGTALNSSHACSVSLQETSVSEESSLDLKRTCVLLLVRAEVGIPEGDLGEPTPSILQEEEKEENKTEGEKTAVPMRSRVDVHTVVLEGFAGTCHSSVHRKFEEIKQI